MYAEKVVFEQSMISTAYPRETMLKVDETV